MGRGLVERLSPIVEGWVWVEECRNVALLVPRWLDEWGTGWEGVGLDDG